MAKSEFKKLAREMAGDSQRGSSTLLLTIITLIASFIFWASITELDSVVRGGGKTKSQANNQLVQSSEPGVIRARYVEEGHIVKKGQKLFDIDPVEAKTQLDQANARKNSLQVKVIRLQAEIDGEVPEFSDELIEKSSSAVSTELALFRARLDDLNTQTAILEQRKLQKLNEIDEQSIELKTAKNGLQLIQREINTIEPLVRSGLAPETRLIELQRQEEETLGRIASAETGQQRVKAGLDEITEQLKAEKQIYLTSALTDLSSIDGELEELSAIIPALVQKVERTSIKSPVDGIINRLNYSTADAYVNQGDILLEIVPTGSDIIVEAKINPKDIADIRLGLDVKVSLTAYDPTRYGRIDGKVVSISADAIADSSTGTSYYVTDISLDGTLYEANGEPVIVLPGMDASIDVLAGKRTLLEYFWQPIARTKSRAFQD